MAFLRKIKDRYYIVYRVDGKQTSRAIGKLNKKQAERELFIFENKGGSYIPTFYEFCFEYIKWHSFEYPASNKRTSQIIESYLIPEFGNYQLDEISIEQCELYKRERSSHVSTGSVIKEITTLKAILNKAVEWGRIPKSPIQYLKKPKQVKSSHPPFYTYDQLQQLYSVCDAHTAALWQFLANTGLRRGEILNLKTLDLKENGVYVVSRDGARTKSGKYRVIPWSDGAKDASRILLETADDYLIDRVRPESLTKKFARAVDRADLDGSLHWLRHTFGSHLVMANVPMRVIQQVMGHSSVTVTEQYAHLDNQYVNNQINRLMI